MARPQWHSTILAGVTLDSRAPCTPIKLRLRTPRRGVRWPMEMARTIRCPYCGQAFDLVIDTSGGYQRLDLDCEICCRPLVAVVECEPGTIVSLDVVAE